jgi:hypothetical protein
MTTEYLLEDDLPLPSFSEIFGEHIGNGGTKKRKRNNPNKGTDEFVNDEITG